MTPQLLRNSIIFLICFTTLLLTSCSGTRPTNIGATNGKLIACPKSPNCVSTQTDNEKAKMEPIAFNSSTEEAKQQLLKVVNEMKRTKVIKEEGNYVHIEFTSALFRFVDDVEFWLDDANKVIHFRSASRLGHSDLGANRKRMTKLVELFGK